MQNSSVCNEEEEWLVPSLCVYAYVAGTYDMQNVAASFIIWTSQYCEVICTTSKAQKTRIWELCLQPI